MKYRGKDVDLNIRVDSDGDVTVAMRSADGQRYESFFCLGFVPGVHARVRRRIRRRIRRWKKLDAREARAHRAVDKLRKVSTGEEEE